MKSEKQKNDLRELARSAAITAQRVDEIGGQITRLRGELVQAKDQRERLFEPSRWGSVRAHLGFNSKSAMLDRKIKDLENDIAKLSSEHKTLCADQVEWREKLEVARQKNGQDRRARCAAAADEAAQNAPSRQRYLDARNKLNDVRSKLREVEAEIHKISVTPIEEQTSAVTEKAREFLSGGELGEVPTIENHNPRLLELTRQSKTLNAAIHIQDQEVRAAQREYSMEVAKNIRPKFNELAQRIAPAAKELVDATVEDALLRIAVAIEAGGADNHLPALRFPGIQIAFSEQALDGYLNRLRLAGYEV